MNTSIVGVIKARIFFSLRRVSCSGATRVVGKLPLLSVRGNLSLGRSVVFRGSQHRTQITVQSSGSLSIGDRSFVNQGVNLFVAGTVRIGRFAKIGDGVAISDSAFHPVGPSDEVKIAPVVIGDNVWIGRGAIIMPGVQIGDNAVVGAASVVTKNVPSNTIVVGAPARIVRSMTGIPSDWVRE